MVWKISCLAPRSMPRVGSSSSSTRGRRCSHLPMTSFLLITPGEMQCVAIEPIGIEADLPRPAWWRWRAARPARRRGLWRTEPISASKRFENKPNASSTRPSRLRSSGANAMPRAIAAPDRRRPRRGPVRRSPCCPSDNGSQSGNTAQNFGAAGADQPRDAEHLPFAEFEIDARNLCRAMTDYSTRKSSLTSVRSRLRPGTICTSPSMAFYQRCLCSKKQDRSRFNRLPVSASPRRGRTAAAPRRDRAK